ncbi:MAG: hypothetical protein H6R26_252 [Proteobacteria bacterium]|nr:hypothetical protein [Pseudomonadota bacterium]
MGLAFIHIRIMFIVSGRNNMGPVTRPHWFPRVVLLILSTGVGRYDHRT